jgi:uncharacterized membrane protein
VTGDDDREAMPASDGHGIVETADAPADDVRFDRIDDVVRWTLAISLAFGFVLLLIGVGLVALGRGTLPKDLDGLTTAWTGFTGLRAEGFFAVGILVIILTPFVRVIGSAIAFAFERDWRFVAITLAVLGVMVLTIRVGVS